MARKLKQLFKIATPREITPLLVDSIKLADNRKIRCRHRDVYFLLSEERQRLLNPGTIQDFATLLKKVKPDIQLEDDDLATMIRSRFIQQPSEIVAWSNYLTDELKAIEDKYEDESGKLENMLKPSFPIQPDTKPGTDVPVDTPSTDGK